jgi:hypothetical protein
VLLLQALLQKPNVTLPDVNAILSAALAQHNANVQVRPAMLQLFDSMDPVSH